MITRRGKSATDQATERALLLEAEGETAAAGIWHRIANEVVRIQRKESVVYAALLALFNSKHVSRKAN